MTHTFVFKIRFTNNQLYSISSVYARKSENDKKGKIVELRMKQISKNFRMKFALKILVKALIISNVMEQAQQRYEDNVDIELIHQMDVINC